MSSSSCNKAFTLIELLIVIAIIAILMVTVTLTLNPGEMFAEARDSRRLSDLATLNRSISYYLATAASTTLSASIMGIISCDTQCFVYNGGGSNCWGRHAAGKTTQAKESQAVDGTGWIAIRFSDTAGGSPIPFEPIDPVNAGYYIYSYACDDTKKTYQFDAMMESVRYSAGGADDKTTNDGGPSSTLYEVGTSPGLGL